MLAPVFIAIRLDGQFGPSCPSSEARGMPHIPQPPSLFHCLPLWRFVWSAQPRLGYNSRGACLVRTSFPARIAHAHGGMNMTWTHKLVCALLVLVVVAEPACAQSVEENTVE